MHDWWTPTAAGYFEHVSKTKTLEAVQVFAPDQVNRLGKLKKGEIASEAERLGERSATFRVQACDTGEVVCEATVTLVAVQRTVIETRIAAKVEALQREHQPVGMAR